MSPGQLSDAALRRLSQWTTRSSPCRCRRERWASRKGGALRDRASSCGGGASAGAHARRRVQSAAAARCRGSGLSRPQRQTGLHERAMLEVPVERVCAERGRPSEPGCGRLLRAQSSRAKRVGQRDRKNAWRPYRRFSAALSARHWPRGRRRDPRTTDAADDRRGARTDTACKASRSARLIAPVWTPESAAPEQTSAPRPSREPTVAGLRCPARDCQGTVG